MIPGLVSVILSAFSSGAQDGCRSSRYHISVLGKKTTEEGISHRGPLDQESWGRTPDICLCPHSQNSVICGHLSYKEALKYVGDTFSSTQNWDLLYKQGRGEWMLVGEHLSCAYHTGRIERIHAKLWTQPGVLIQGQQMPTVFLFTGEVKQFTPTHTVSIQEMRFKGSLGLQRLSNNNVKGLKDNWVESHCSRTTFCILCKIPTSPFHRHAEVCLSWTPAEISGKRSEKQPALLFRSRITWQLPKRQHKDICI